MGVQKTDTNTDVKALEQAFEAFTETTRTLEESYRRLEHRVHELDAELAKKNRELQVTRDYLEYILESISDGVIAVDSAGVITAFNTAAGAVLGLQAADVVGESFRRVFGRDFIASPRSGPGEVVVGALRAQDGVEIPVTERDSPIADRSGARIGTAKVFQDLSEIEALREHARRIDRLAAIGEMAATVAHEIRNPLGGLKGFASLLDQDVDEGDPRKRLVSKIIEGARGLDRVVTELLDYTQPVDLRLESVSCKEVVESALSFVDYDHARVAVEFDISSEDLVYADRDKLRQVLLNVLLNAVQSIEGAGTIRVSSQTTDGRVVLAVADTGCGMNDTELAQAFSPFFTTKEKGTGLGLATALKIVEGHGGSLAIGNGGAGGCVVSITLPRADAAL